MSEEIKLYAAHFAEIYDGKAQRFFKSPGRINLAGEHTDYNLGKVLPIAINHHLLIAISPNGKNSSPSLPQMKAVAQRANIQAD